jgi:arylsulfatase A-like enzyme
MEILDRIGDSSFFLWLHYMEPHDPYFDIDGNSYAKVSDPHPPVAWQDRMRQAYRDDVHRFDKALGELLDAIDARGISERTTVIVVADHGEEFADHGGFYHGVTLYEEQLHVPLVIAGPGVTPAVDTSLAQQIDIAPTVLARFAVEAPAAWEGRDLLGDSEPPASTLAEENHEGNVLASVRTGDMKLILANEDNPRGLPPEALFDLAADPGEQTNLAGASPAVAELRDELLDLKTAAQSGAAKADAIEMDEERREELRSLGYIK